MMNAAGDQVRLWPRMCITGVQDRQFEAEVAQAARLGATHVDISQLPAKPRHEKTDPQDPYLEYSFIGGCLFRFVVPEEIRPMTPATYEQTTMTALRRRCAVLRQHGLKARLWLLEPHAVPEEVFAAHPAWRGPRVDFPTRSRRPYYALCIDHPEVLTLYRQTVARLCRELPEIDTFRLTTNDSGAGICWSARLYSGVNGPAACRQHGYGERVRGFLQAWIDGAADAGVQARVLLSPRGMAPEQAEAARLGAPDRGVVLPAPEGFPNASVSAGGPPGTVGIANPIAFVHKLAAARDAQEVLVGCGRSPLHWRLLERFVQAPAQTYVEQTQLLSQAAQEMAGAGHREALLQAWQQIDQALRRIPFMPWGGLIFEHAVKSKRWITRPLVPFPEELTEPETSFWKPYLFEAGYPGESASLVNIHAVYMMEGLPQAHYLRLSCQQGAGELEGAAASLETIATAGAVRGMDEELRLLAARLRALACLYQTIGNVTMFQAFLDRAGQEGKIGESWIAFWTNAGPVRPVLAQILREEMDNALQLASLLESAPEPPEPLLDLAESSEEEDCFTLPPDLPAKLRLKAKVMQDHIPDLERLLPFPMR